MPSPSSQSRPESWELGIYATVVMARPRRGENVAVFTWGGGSKGGGGILTAADISRLEEFRGEQNQAVIRKGIGKPVGGKPGWRHQRGTRLLPAPGGYAFTSLGRLLEPCGDPEQGDGWQKAS